MATTLNCVGFDLTTEEQFLSLWRTIRPDARVIGRASGYRVSTWQDGSGARLSVTTDEGDRLAGLTPSFAAEPLVDVGDVHLLNGQTVAVDVLDTAGEVATRVALELEEAALLPAAGLRSGRAAIVALGADVQVHASPEEFLASPASLLSGTADAAGEPRRLAPESLISLGIFDEPDQAMAFARFNGSVLQVRNEVNRVSGTSFVVALTRTASMTVDVCIPTNGVRPRVGGTISGTVLLVGSIPALQHRP